MLTGAGERSEPEGGDLTGAGERSGPSVTLRGTGHPSIRATHTKTVELTAEHDLSARATCVVATVPATDLEALSGLRGSVTVTLRAAGTEDRITGVANPRFAGGPRAVLRRSDHRSPDTLMTQADKAAADLDRDLVQALADPATQVEILIELGVDPPRRTAELLLFPWRVVAALTAGGPPAGDPPPAAGWTAALRSASLVVGAGPGVEPARRFARDTGQRMATDIALLRPEMERGAVTALVCELGPLAARVAALADELARDGWTVRATGVPVTTAARVAAGLAAVPFADCGTPPGATARRRRQIAALAAAGVAGVWSGRVAALTDLLGDVAAFRPAAHAGLSLAVDEPDEEHHRGEAADLVTTAGALRGGHRAVAVVDLGADPSVEAPEVAVPDLLRALLDEGVAPSTLARGLARLPGVSRKQAYDLTLALKRT
jgi:hypothetical protein